MYISPNFSNRKKVQNYRFCIFEVGEFKQIQEILSKIGTEFFEIDEEMTEKNEAENGNSISLKSPWHMK